MMKKIQGRAMAQQQGIGWQQSASQKIIQAQPSDA